MLEQISISGKNGEKLILRVEETHISKHDVNIKLNEIFEKSLSFDKQQDGGNFRDVFCKSKKRKNTRKRYARIDVKYIKNDTKTRLLKRNFKKKQTFAK